MKTAVSNSGPLIHLANIGLIDFLFNLVGKIYIPSSVYQEVVIKGKKHGHSDSKIMEDAINNERIIVKEVKEKKDTYHSPRLHPGELDAIQLASVLDVTFILLDDEEARIFARKLQINVKGSLGILFDLLKDNYLELEEALVKLKQLNSIMYLSSDVYNYIREQLKKVSNHDIF